jgi:prolyl-tRNA synthetase
MLEGIQEALYARALEFRVQHTIRVQSLDDLVKFLKDSIGFAVTPWCGREEDERTVKDRTTATTRVILGDLRGKETACTICGRPATVEVAWGKAY